MIDELRRGLCVLCVWLLVLFAGNETGLRIWAVSPADPQADIFG
jgi:hypothetical protein